MEIAATPAVEIKDKLLYSPKLNVFVRISKEMDDDLIEMMSEGELQEFDDVHTSPSTSSCPSETAGGSSTATFTNTSIGTVIRATTANLTDLLKKGPAGGKTSTTNIKNEPEINYVYDFGTRTGKAEEIPMIIYELYRTRTCQYLHFRACAKRNPDEYEKGIIGVIRTGSIMLASILDNQGNIVQAEKVAVDVQSSEPNMRFEIEDFVCLSDLTEILKTNSGINIRITFVCTQIFPVKTTAAYGSTQAPCSSNAKVPFGFTDFYIHDSFNTQIQTKVLDEDFTDGTFRVITENKKEKVIPIFRVFLAAQSPVLEILLRRLNSEVVIEGFEEEVVLAFLDYMYSGEVYVEDVNRLTSLIKLADIYRVLSLREKCIRNIILHFSRKSKGPRQISIDYFRLGKQLKSPLLVQMALDQHRKFGVFIRFPRTKNSAEKPIARSSKTKLANTTIIGKEAYEESRVIQNLEELYCSPPRVEEYIKACEAPSDKTRSSATVGITSMGFLYRFPANMLDSLWETPVETDFDENGEKIYLEYELTVDSHIRGSALESCKLSIRSGQLQLYKTKGSNDVNLRILKFPEADPVPDEDEDKLNVGSILALLDPEVLKYFKIFCKNSICCAAGRCVHEAYCTSFTREEDSVEIWENVPFIKEEEFHELENMDKDLVILTAMIHHRKKDLNYTLDSEPPSKESSTDDSKACWAWDTKYLCEIVMDSYSHRLHTMLHRPAFSDATIYLVDKDDHIIQTIYVNKVIVCAYSELMKTAIKDYPRSESEIFVSTEDFSVESIKGMLHYIYGMHVPSMDLQLGLELLNICRDFGMGPRFKENINLSLLNIKLWTFQFALIFYQYGHFVKERTMKEAAIDCFKKNKAEFVGIPEFQEFLKTFPELGERLKLDKSKENETTDIGNIVDKACPIKSEQELPKNVVMEVEIEELRAQVMEAIHNTSSLDPKEKRVREALEVVVKERDEERLRRLPKITAEMEIVINAAKTGSDSDVFTYSSGKITRNDLKSLAQGAFPTDQILDEYLALVNFRSNDVGFKKIIAFPEAVYRCLKDGQCSFDSQSISLAGAQANFEIILFPAKHRTHWFLIAVFPMTREIKCYDNRHKDRDYAVSLIKMFLVIFLGERRKNKDYPTWTTEMVKNIPKLKQSCDSAVYVCKYAEYLTTGKRLVFNNDHIDYFRDMMIWEIVQQKLN